MSARVPCPLLAELTRYILISLSPPDGYWKISTYYVPGASLRLCFREEGASHDSPAGCAIRMLVFVCRCDEEEGSPVALLLKPRKSELLIVSSREFDSTPGSVFVWFPVRSGKGKAASVMVQSFVGEVWESWPFIAIKQPW